jgi:hypothetical protein
MTDRDIVVTFPVKSSHKLETKIKVLADGGYAWWDLKRAPVSISMDSKVFVIYDSLVRGYFTISNFDDDSSWENAHAVEKRVLYLRADIGAPPDGISLRIVFEKWYPIEPVEMTGFRGFRYRRFSYKNLYPEVKKEFAI